MTRFIVPIALCAAAACAQSGGSQKLAFILPDIFEQAIQLADPNVRPVLRASITPRWVSLNSSVAAQLSNLPNPSPASAFRYSYDPDSGAVQRTRQSLGPVLTERAETIGREKFFFAVTHQRFSFDRLDDLDLRGFEVSFPISVPTGPFTVESLLNADALIHLNVDQTTAHFTYGLTHWLEASYAFPIVRSSLIVRGGASLSAGGASLVDLPRLSMHASATGLGDGVLRAKARVLSRKRVGIALATDVRLPTGDEFNYHGAGAYGVKPFLIASINTDRISPHLNVGYQWNGESYLASQYATQKRSLPGQIFYAVGFDAGISPRMTLAFDILNQIIISGQRTFLGSASVQNTPPIYFDDVTRQEYSAAIGIKAQIRSDLVMTGNVMLRLNDAGLRARVVPLAGISYLF